VQLTANIILIGMKHSGKTTLGRRLAEHCEAPFFDSDDTIESLYARTREKRSCRDIFTALGHEGFALLESEAVTELSAGCRNHPFSVIALGGGTAENSEAMKSLSGVGKFVHITEAPEILYARIIRNGIPPFLDPDDPERSFRMLWERRTRRYEKIAHITIPLTGAGQDEAFAIVTDRLKEAGYVR